MSLSRIHARLLPKMGKYAGFDLPLSFSKFNVKDVVEKTRKPNFTTVFDVSHMGVYETIIEDNVTYKLSNLLKTNLKNLKNNQAKLTVILNERGNVLDDLIISNVENKKYRLVVNASNNTTNFFDNFTEGLKKKEKSIIALQGDGSQKLVENIINDSLSSLYFMENKVMVDNKFEICRCGYTGEDGFELYLNDKYGEEIYEHLVTLAEKEDSNVLFGGLIERDCLRLEAGLNLSGAEFGDKINVKFNSINMPFLIDKTHRVNLEKSNMFQTLLSSDKPIRRGDIFINGYNGEEKIGFITSTVKSFNLNKFIGIGYLNKYISYPELEEIPIYIKDRKNNITFLKKHDKLIKNNYYRKPKPKS